MKAAAAGLVLVGLLVGGWWLPYDPLVAIVAERLQPPSVAHWFGTDAVGRDVWSRVFAASRVDFSVALMAVAGSASVGSLIGAVAGLCGGWLDAVLLRLVDGLLSFPLFVVALVLVAVLGNDLRSVIIATALINLPFYIRLARVEVAARRALPYVNAARLDGMGEGRLLLTVLLPNALPTLVVQASVNLGWVMLNTAGLAFLGVGVHAPTPEWGVEVADGEAYLLTGEWWLTLWPSAALVVVVLCLTVLGDGLRDWLDPRKHYPRKSP